MSPRSSDPNPRSGGPAPQPDVYVGLLFVSLAALLTGLIFLIFELNRYEWQVFAQ